MGFDLENSTALQKIRQRLASGEPLSYAERIRAVATFVRVVRHTIERAPLRMLMHKKSAECDVFMPGLEDGYVKSCLGYLLTQHARQLNLTGQAFGNVLLGFVDFIQASCQNPDVLYQRVNQAFHDAHSQFPCADFVEFREEFCRHYGLYEVIQGHTQNQSSSYVAMELAGQGITKNTAVVFGPGASEGFDNANCGYTVH